MESSKINEMFDNEYGMNSQAAIDLIKLYFAQYFSSFSLIDEYKKNSGYWGLRYSYENIIIFITCGRGYLENEITIDGKEISLLDFEPLMKNVEFSSEKNILFTLNTIKRYVEGT